MKRSLIPSARLCSNRTHILAMIAVALLANPSKADEPAPKPPMNLVIATIYSDGNNILMARPTPVEGEPVEQTYTVMIPSTLNGVTTMRSETRTRMVTGMKLTLSPVRDGTYFQNVAGKKLDIKDVAIEIPKAGRQVIMISDPNMKELPTEWSQLFKENVVVMRTRIE